MKEFIFSAEVTVSASTRVFAETKEEARQIVEDRDVELEDRYPSLSEKEVWIIKDADGTPTNIHLEEEE